MGVKLQSQYIESMLVLGYYPWEGRKEWDDFIQFIVNNCEQEFMKPTFGKDMMREYCHWVDAEKLLPPWGKWVLVCISYKNGNDEFCSWAKAAWQQGQQRWFIPDKGISDNGKVTHWRFIDSPYDKDEIL